MSNTLSVEVVASKILFVRGKKIMIDKDLAQLYGVATKNLNKAVKETIKDSPKILCSNLATKSWKV